MFMEAQARYFAIKEEALDYLRARDKQMAQAIDLIGPIRRQVHPDLFAALVNSVVGQQISTQAQTTIWNRMCERFGAITPEIMTTAPPDEIQSCGMSMRKVEYIQDTALAIVEGRLNLQELQSLPDSEVIARLSALRGIGVWTAEMLLLFSMQRPNIFSFDDLAIHRGLRMLYHHRTVDRERFERYRRRYSPHGSVASLYLWAVASGQYGYQDHAPKAMKPGAAKNNTTKVKK